MMRTLETTSFTRQADMLICHLDDKKGGSQNRWKACRESVSSRLTQFIGQAQVNAAVCRWAWWSSEAYLAIYTRRPIMLSNLLLYLMNLWSHLTTLRFAIIKRTPSSGIQRPVHKDSSEISTRTALQSSGLLSCIISSSSAVLWHGPAKAETLTSYSEQSCLCRPPFNSHIYSLSGSQLSDTPSSVLQNESLRIAAPSRNHLQISWRSQISQDATSLDPEMHIQHQQRGSLALHRSSSAGVGTWDQTC